MTLRTTLAIVFFVLLPIMVVVSVVYAPHPPEAIEVDPVLFEPVPIVTPEPKPDVPPITPSGQSEPQTQPATTAAPSCPGGVCNPPGLFPRLRARRGR